MSEQIEVGKIQTDGGTQARASLNHATVTEYANAMRNGDEFPPITVFYDGAVYWLADGFHRVAAHDEAFGNGNAPTIRADVSQGVRRDAVLQSAGANAVHGLPRTRTDKNRAVLSLLKDEEWGKWSDREIGRRCHVSHPTVATLRKTLTGKFTSGERVYERDGKTAVMQTGKIGNSVMKKREGDDGQFVADRVDKHVDVGGGMSIGEKTGIIGNVGTSTRKVTRDDITMYLLDSNPQVLDGDIARIARDYFENVDADSDNWMLLKKYMSENNLHAPHVMFIKSHFILIASEFETKAEETDASSEIFTDAHGCMLGWQLEETVKAYRDDGGDMTEAAIRAYLSEKNIKAADGNLNTLLKAHVDNYRFEPPILSVNCPNDDTPLSYTPSESDGYATAAAFCPKCNYKAKYDCRYWKPVWEIVWDIAPEESADETAADVPDERGAWVRSQLSVVMGMIAESNADAEPDVTAALNNLKQVMLDTVKVLRS